MDGYAVESTSLKEVKRLISKGDWKRSKAVLKDLLKDDRFRVLAQIDKCFIARFLGERYKSEHKFDEAIRLHKLYCAVAKGSPVEEQRAFATLGSTFHDSSIFTGGLTEKTTALEQAERFTMLAVKAAKQLLADGANGISRAESGHMMARGLFNLALIEVSRCVESSVAKAITCLEKALRIFKEYVNRPSATSSGGPEVDTFHVTVYLELATLYRQSHRLNDLWQVATDGVQLAEKLLSDANDGRGRVKLRRTIAKFLMFKSVASLGECHFDIAARLAGEALKTLTSQSGLSATKKAKRRKIVKNEYALDDEFDDEDEVDADGAEADDSDLSTRLHHFKRTCCRLAKKAKKLSSMLKSNSRATAAYAKTLENIADLLFDVGVFNQAKKFYEQALLHEATSTSSHHAQLGIVVSIGRCLLSLGPKENSFDQFVFSLKEAGNGANLGRFRASGDDLASLYEVAVDHFIDSGSESQFKKYVRLEMDVRHATLRRLSEIWKRIAELSDIPGLSAKDKKPMADAFDDLVDDLGILKQDVEAAAETLSNSSDGSIEESSMLSSSVSSSSSSDEDADKAENDAPSKNAKDFMPVRLKRNEKGETQLHVACRTGNTAKAEQLLKAGHPVNVRDGSGWFPIHDAADAGCMSIVGFLLANGADINCSNDLNGLTPAMEAAKNGHLFEYRRVLRLLVNKGANCDAKDNRARSILHFLRESRRDNESIMSSADLADWMELESLVLGKMRKPPATSMKTNTETTSSLLSSAAVAVVPRPTIEAVKTKRSSFESTVSAASASTKASGRLSSDEASSSAEDAAPSKRSASKINSDPVSLYQSAMGNVGRSAKVAKRKADGQQQQCRSEALTSMVINNPFLEDAEAEDNDWLVDDIGVRGGGKSVKRTMATKKRKQKSASPSKPDASNQASGANVALSHLITAIEHGAETSHFATLFDNSDLNREEVDIEPLPPGNFLQKECSSDGGNGRVLHLIDNEDGQQIQKFAKSSVVPSEVYSGLYLTIRVHIDREGSARRDSLLINNIDKHDTSWDIKRLRQEVSLRYAALFGQSPVISSMRLLDGTTLADDSRLEPIARQHEELIAVVDRWELPPLYTRYTTACSLSSVTPALETLQVALKAAEISGRLDMSSLLLPNCQVRCILKALNHQSNISYICLAGNRLDGSIAKVFAESLFTLPNLTDLDLSLASLNIDDLAQIAQALVTQRENCGLAAVAACRTARIRRLNLSYNSFVIPFRRNSTQLLSQASRFAEAFSMLIRFFSSSLRRLSLVSCDLEGDVLFSGCHDRLLIGEAFQSVSELNELDIGQNPFGTNGLEFMLTRAVVLGQLTVLRLDGPLSSRMLAEAEQAASLSGRLIAHMLTSAPRLTQLSLSGNSLDDDAVVEFASKLEQAACLAELDLSANPKISAASFVELSRHFRKATSLVRVDLGCTGVASPIEAAFDYLADKMDSQGPLTRIVLPAEKLSDSDLENLKQVLNCSTRSKCYLPVCSLTFS